MPHGTCPPGMTNQVKGSFSQWKLLEGFEGTYGTFFLELVPFLVLFILVSLLTSVYRSLERGQGPGPIREGTHLQIATSPVDTNYIQSICCYTRVSLACTHTDCPWEFRT